MTVTRSGYVVMFLVVIAIVWLMFPSYFPPILPSSSTGSGLVLPSNLLKGSNHVVWVAERYWVTCTNVKLNSAVNNYDITHELNLWVHTNGVHEPFVQNFVDFTQYGADYGMMSAPYGVFYVGSEDYTDAQTQLGVQPLYGQTVWRMNLTQTETSSIVNGGHVEIIIVNYIGSDGYLHKSFQITTLNKQFDLQSMNVGTDAYFDVSYSGTRPNSLIGVLPSTASPTIGKGAMSGTVTLWTSTGTVITSPTLTLIPNSNVQTGSVEFSTGLNWAINGNVATFTATGDKTNTGVYLTL